MSKIIIKIFVIIDEIIKYSNLKRKNDILKSKIYYDKLITKFSLFFI